jgi:magnesium chelatase family protein
VFVRVLSFALEGIEAFPVTVEVDVSPGIPAFDIVGLPDAAVRESRERVRAAIRNGGWTFPAHRITVNLAPAHTRKGGAGFDLAVGLGILAAGGHLSASVLHGMAFAGELALDGALRPVRGALAIALASRKAGARALVVPLESAAEATLAGGTVYGAVNLVAVVNHITGAAPLEEARIVPESNEGSFHPVDLADVKGQLAARRALEVAAAGGHNLIMMGPPGAGKSMLARCLPGILPPLEPEEALEVSRIHSVVGLLAGNGGLLRTRPFRAPHHCASRSAVLGGGTPLRPGEITLAHRGVLFLDEVPEFDRPVLEGLRQPLEDGKVSISRAHGNAVFPARPMLVAAANPCPCGYLGNATRACTCPPVAITQYRSRLSGPLLDRFDLQIHLEPVPYDDLVTQTGTHPSESSLSVRSRVAAARARQRKRFYGTGLSCNAEMPVHLVRRFCRLPGGGEVLMRQAMERMGLSLRAHDRILKVSRTIADLAGADEIEIAHLAEALQYRSIERSVLVVSS